MQKIVFINSQKEMVEDIETAALLEFDLGYELHCFYKLEGIVAAVTMLKPDLVVLSYNALIQKKTWDFNGIPIAFHAKDEKELRSGARYGFPTVGAAKTPDEILECLKEPPYQLNTGGTKEKQNVKQTKQVPPKTAPAKDTERRDPSDRPVKHKEKRKEPVQLEEYDPDNSFEEDDLFYDNEEDYDDLDEEWNDDVGQDDADIDEDDTEGEIEDDTDVPEEPEPSQKKKRMKASKSRTSHEENKGQSKNKQKDDIIKEGFRRDTGKTGVQTKVITVYSAKGGVGKTTIASELATYLALVNVGRKKLRVCIVDYNIDFGDVRTTLHINGGLTLTDWAEEVQELLEKGKLPEDIRYSKDEIEAWMQVEKKSGLFVLPAPISNADSMGIESEALSVILDNIVKYGKFDFVVCDTGNNTRDSTMIALEKATTIILIMTQNVNTANCDKAFVDTMHTIDFDLSNAKLVINNIMPQKTTGLSVQEIVEFFPYDCIGKLKFNMDVVKAGNLGEPLAFKPSHEFTKQLRSIVSYVLQDGSFEDYSVSAPKKKSLFSFLKK